MSEPSLYDNPTLPESELRKCPFCGKNNWKHHVGISYGEYECRNCGARTPHAIDKTQATKLANTRADDALLDDMATALETLMSEQNGAPLIRRTEAWAESMNTADSVLTRYRERGK